MPEDLREESTDKQGDAKIIATSKKRFELCVEEEKDRRKVGEEDLKFRAGEQWPQSIVNQRAMESRPCLTVNVLPARERQILNDQRQNRQAIKVSPVDDEGDEETAEIIAGIVRHIEYDSNADIAYDTASAYQLRMGWGYIRLVTVEEDGQQVIKIRRVANPFQIYMDPSCQEADYSDANFGFVFETLTKDEYLEQYPNTEIASLADWTSKGDIPPDWLSKDSVRVVEYFFRDKSGKIQWVKHDAIQVLDRTEWPGKWIPIIPVLGDELFIDGKRVLEGLVRWAKDPMRMKNVTASATIETIMLAPKAPWLAAAGQTEDFPEWKTANIQNHAVLRYKPVEVGGKDVGPPQRLVQEPAIQAIGATGAYFDEAVRDVMGIYEAQYGARSQEKSGRAIIAKKQQGEIANFHYVDNLSRAIRFLGRQIVDLIPRIMSRKQVVRIIGEDGSAKLVKVNQKFQVGQDQQGNPIHKIYDLTVGKYDVAISSGASYQTKRQEGFAGMVDLTKVAPQIGQVAPDLLVRLSDVPYSDEIADRLKKTLPPGLADDDPTDPKAMVQQMQTQMRQAGQQIEMLAKVNTELLDTIREKKIEQEGKLQLAELQERTKILVAEITTKAQESQMRIKMEQEQWLALHGSAADRALAAQQAAQSLQQQQDQQQHEVGMQANDQAQEQTMAAQAAAQQDQSAQGSETQANG